MGILDVPLRLPSSLTPLAGRKAVFLGDSITNGSNAGAGRRFVDQIPKVIGTELISATNSVTAGVPGQKSDAIAARYATDVRGNGAQVLFVLAGTNDVGQGSPLSIFQTSIMSIVANAKRDGIPVIIGTVPPRGASTATAAIRQSIDQFNLWLNLWAPSAGVRVAQVFKNLAGSTGDMVTAYDSGDGTHPNTLGHQQVANAFADAYAGLGTSISPVTSVTTMNLVNNPLQVGAGTQPTGYYEQGGGTGTAPTYSIDTDTTGALKAGRWATMTFDGTAIGGTRYYLVGITAGGFVAGDVMAVFAKIKTVDGGGYFASTGGDTPGSSAQVRVFDQNFSNVRVFSANSVRAGGNIADTFTIPAGTTGLIFGMGVTVATGAKVSFSMAELGIFNATTLGIANLI